MATVGVRVCACGYVWARMSTLIHTHIHRRHVNTNTNLHAPAHHHQQPHFVCCLHTHACPPVHMHTITLLVMPTLSAIRFSFVSVCGYGSGMSWVGIRWDIPAGANIYAHMCTHMRLNTCMGTRKAHTHTHAHARPRTHAATSVPSVRRRLILCVGALT